MKAMVLTGPGKPFQLTNVPDPVPGKGEAVARVFACGTGLTIQHIRAGRSPVEYPRIIGHEIAAEIVATGKGVNNLAIGDAVTAYYYLTCGHCAWCLRGRETLCDNFAGQVGKNIDGGYAEYVKLPASAFMKLPGGLIGKATPAEIGVIADAIATPVKLLGKARIEPGETVVVIGAGGGLGLHMVLVAHWAGARVVAIEPRPEKSPACRDAGAEAILDPGSTDLSGEIRTLTRGAGADVVVDFVATPTTLETGIDLLGKGGRLAILGGGGSQEPFRASGDRIKSREIEILGSKYATRTEVRTALDLVATGALRPVVTETRPLEDAEALHQRVEAGLVTGRAALVMDSAPSVIEG
jgi:propanol-preferring alcohol dehydrogenase